MNEELKATLKKKGLGMAEDYLKMMLDDVDELGKLLVESTENSFDDMAFQGVLMFKGELVKLIDTLDGEEG
ncbi:MAG: hypothetical protein HRT70_10615 [Flavobacteriaceae bacterium]|nr:hypothetical protein [Flavobacteriaceae bacterium]